MSQAWLRLQACAFALVFVARFAPAADSLPPMPFVVSLAQDANGNVWAGTEDRGVFRYGPAAKIVAQWSNFTTKDGLGDDNAYAICADKLGRIWVGHLNHAVSVYNGDNRIRLFQPLVLALALALNIKAVFPGGHPMKTSLLPAVGLLIWATARAGFPNDGVALLSNFPPSPEDGRAHVRAVERLVDGAAVCQTSTGFFLSLDDPRKWSQLPLEKSQFQRGTSLSLAGGDRSRLFIIANGHSGLAMFNLDVNSGELRMGISLRSGMVAFASGKIGAMALRRNLQLTKDGGENWTPSGQLITKDGANISAFVWLSKTRLLVGGDDDSVQLFELDDHTLDLRRVWSKVPNPQQRGASNFAVDGDHAWGGKYALKRFRIDNGEVDGAIDFEVLGRRLTAIHQHVLVIGDGENAKTVLNWTPNGAAYAPGPGIPAGEVRGILPLAAPECLMITDAGAGEVADLSSGKVTVAKLEVEWHEPKPDPGRPTKAEFDAMMELALKVPYEQRNAIFKEANEKKELTAKQNVGWVTERLKQALANSSGASGGPKNEK